MIPEEDNVVTTDPYAEYPYAEDIKVATELNERLYITTDAYKQLIRKWRDRFGVKP